MSPPIRDGSGSSIGSIRLGDGSEISEVRTGARDVLFSAIPDSVVDNFEEPLYEDKNNTLTDYYDGDLSQASRQQTTVLKDSRSLKVSQGGFIGSTSGLPRYPNQDETFRIFVQNPSSGGRIYVYFFLQSSTGFGGYRVGVRPGLDDLVLQESNPNNTQSRIEKTSVSLSTGTTYFVDTLPQSNGTITATLFDTSGTQLAQVSGTNTTYTDGGIGFEAEVADAVFDDVTVI